MTRLTIFLAVALAGSAAHADTAGLRIENLFLPHHDSETRVAIWYPSSADQGATLYADNPVFQGVEAHMDAPLSDGQHPVVLFSHGMGGTDRAQAWLGSALAERGAIVVMVNHPNTTWGDFDMSKGIAHWIRAQDLSTAMDALEQDPVFAQGIDEDRIMAAGFSYGGWTALSLAGARNNHAGALAACDTHRDAMELCDLLLSDEVQLQSVDPELWNASYADPRVTAAFSIDPGFVWGLEAADLSSLLPKVAVVGFGGAQDRLFATNFDESGLADLLGDRQIVRFDPAYHFSAMPLCKPEGEAILLDEQDDSVCTDPAGSDRAAIHAEIIDMMAEELGL